MIFLAPTGLEYGLMSRHERNTVENSDVFFGMSDMAEVVNENGNHNGYMIDSVLSIVVLLISCVVGMIYSEGV